MLVSSILVAYGRVSTPQYLSFVLPRHLMHRHGHYAGVQGGSVALLTQNIFSTFNSRHNLSLFLDIADALILMETRDEKSQAFRAGWR